MGPPHCLPAYLTHTLSQTFAPVDILSLCRGGCAGTGRSVPSEVRRGRVEEVVLDLGLKECAHTLVGNEHVR